MIWYNKRVETINEIVLVSKGGIVLSRDEKVALMLDLFAHPKHGFAKQVYHDGTGKQKRGTYFYRETDGECDHTPRHKRLSQCPSVKEVLLTKQDVLAHLKGEITIAPYQISKDATVKWICIDIDGYQEVAPEKLQTMTKVIAIAVKNLLGPNHCFVETSGSKGYHVWLLFEEPTPVNLAYALGHKIINGIQVTNEINVEVYPKQQSGMTFGNTVKIPFGIHRKTGNRCFLLRSDFTPYEDQWSALQKVTRIPLKWVQDNVTPYVPPPKESGSFEYVPKYPVCLMEIMEKGVSEGIRDEAALRIACYWRDKQMPKQYVELVLTEWNDNNSPPMDHDDLLLKIDQAFERDYPFRPCHMIAFDQFCHSSCAYFDSKVERRWFQSHGDPIGVISKD